MGFVQGNTGKVFCISLIIIAITRLVFIKMYRKIIYSTNLEVGQGKKVLITGASSGLGRELAI